MQLPELRTPFARAVVPVAAGIAFFAVLGLVLWGTAAWLSGGNGERVRLGDTEFTVGRVDRIADSIAANGPQLYADLKTTSGARSVVVDHAGGTDTRGWSVYLPFPADRPGTSCLATQTPGTATFVDCEGRRLSVDDLQPAADVTVEIIDATTLVLQFAGATADSVG